MNNYNLYNGQCILCNIQGCLLCQQPNICSLCSPGYQPNSIGLCIYCTIINCQSCSSNNLCFQCVNNSGLVPSTYGDQCLYCNVTNCISCSDNNICRIC